MQYADVRPLTEIFAEAKSRHMSGDLRGAEVLLRQVLTRDGGHVDAMRGLGMICLDTGRPDEALTLLSQAAKLSPTALSWQLLAIGQSRCGRFDAAVPSYREALTRDPHDVQTLCNLANALHALKRDEEALTPLRQAVAIAPDFLDAHALLGMVLMARNAPEEALRCHRYVLSRDPRRADTLRLMGLTLHALNRHREAAEAFRRALSLRPADAGALGGLGAVLAELGDIPGARAALERALAVDPRNPQHHYALAFLKTFREADPQVPLLRKLAPDVERYPLPAQLDLHYALAKMYDDLGQPSEAFAHLSAANAVKRGQVTYDEARECGELSALAEAFPADALCGAPGGDPSELPVFIVGMPRSGTTLVEQMLAAHPDVFGAGERKYLPALVDRARAGRSVTETVSRMSEDDWTRFGRDYVAALGTLAPQARRVTDKLPGNFRYLGFVRRALPHARILHVRRDAMDTCFSCYSRMLHGEVAFAYDLTELGHYYRAYEALMAHWREALPPGAMCEISYEELVGDFETVAKRIVDFCGLAWNAACLDFRHAARPVSTASLYQVRQPVTAKSVGRWRAYAAELEPLRAALCDDACAGAGKVP